MAKGAQKTPRDAAKALLYQMLPITQLSPDQIHQYAPEIDLNAPGSAFAKVRVPVQQPPAPAPAPTHPHASHPAGPGNAFKEMQEMAQVAGQTLNPISVDRTQMPLVTVDRTPMPEIVRSPKTVAKSLLDKKKR